MVIWGDYKEKRSLGKLKAFNKGQRYQGKKSLATTHVRKHPFLIMAWHYDRPQTYNINELDMFVNLTMLSCNTGKRHK